MRLLFFILILFSINLQATERCSDLLLAQKHKENYICSKCAVNVQTMAMRLESTEDTEVLFIFNPQFKLIEPSKELLPNQLGWKYHVVLRVGNKILDLDDPASTSGKPLNIQTYFRKYFAKEIRTLRVSRIPTDFFLENFKFGRLIESGLVFKPKGWMRPFAKHEGYREDSWPYKIIMRFETNEALYYMNSEHALRDNPPVPLDELLAK